MGRSKYPRLLFQLHSVEASGVLGVYANCLL